MPTILYYSSLNPIKTKKNKRAKTQISYLAVKIAEEKDMPFLDDDATTKRSRHTGSVTLQRNSLHLSLIEAKVQYNFILVRQSTNATPMTLKTSHFIDTISVHLLL